MGIDINIYTRVNGHVGSGINVYVVYTMRSLLQYCNPWNSVAQTVEYTPIKQDIKLYYSITYIEYRNQSTGKNARIGQQI